PVIQPGPSSSLTPVYLPPPTRTLDFLTPQPTPTASPHTLSLHDALPISQSPERLPPSLRPLRPGSRLRPLPPLRSTSAGPFPVINRKITRLNSSYLVISYVVFCLKTKRRTQAAQRQPIQTQG